MSTADKDVFTFDSDFAVVCSFLQKFSNDLEVNYPGLNELQNWLSNTSEVPHGLKDLHVMLLRRTRRTVHPSHWEKALIKFISPYSLQDGLEIKSRGYQNLSTKIKLRVLRALLESQFDYNNKFHSKILAMSADSLRSKPIGRDELGNNYWLTQDMHLRVYQEHLDEGIWKMVATNRNQLLKLKCRLKDNKMVLPSEIDEDERRKMEEFALQNTEFGYKKKLNKADDDTLSVNFLDHEDAEFGDNIKKTRKYRRKYRSTSDSDQEEESLNESDNDSSLFKSDHEFSPESVSEDESQIVPLKQARTARKQGDKSIATANDEESCQKCGKADLPEWILLCDECDKGYHCSCLSPILFNIPDGEWICPACQHKKLINALTERFEKSTYLMKVSRTELVKRKIGKRRLTKL